LSIHIAIPACDELDYLPHTLKTLAEQEDLDFHAWVCINQPPGTSINNPKTHAANLATIDYIENSSFNFPITTLEALDSEVDGGVGWARNHLAKHIYEQDQEGLTVCLDADTKVDSLYITSIRAAYQKYPSAVGLAAPYYHPLPDEPRMARHLLRYEIYMRTYQLNLWKIQSPYAYLSLGSAMSYRNKAWKTVHGIPKRSAGEDFYFLQKLRKTGDLIRWIPSTVFPSSRYSDRVPFGTGVLLSEPSLDLQKKRFPFFPKSSFQKMKETFTLFETLYDHEIQLPIDDFLDSHMKGHEAFNKIRKNSRTAHQFVHNAHQYFDALRTLQFLKYDFSNHQLSGEILPVCFETDTVEELNHYRNHCFEQESSFQRCYMENWHSNQPSI